MNSNVSPIYAPLGNAQPQSGTTDGGERPGMNILDILATLRNGIWWIVTAVVLCTLLGWFVAWRAVPVYQSDALVQVEKGNSQRRLSNAIGESGSFVEDSRTSDEIEIIKSRMVLGRVVQSSNADIVARPHYFPLIGEAMARGHAQSRQPVPAFLGLEKYAWGGERIEVDALDVPPDMVNRALQLVAGRNGAFELLAGPSHLLTGRVGSQARQGIPGTGGAVTVFVRVLTARLGTRFDLAKQSEATTVNQLDGALNVASRGRDTSMIGLTYQDIDPQRAQRVLNRILDTYQRQNVDRRMADTEQTLAFLQDQLPQLRQKVEDAETSLKNYQVRQGSVNLPEETTQLLAQEVTLETQQRELEGKRQEALKRFTESNPQVQLIDEQIARLGAERGRIEGRTRLLPQTQQELLSLKRDVEVNTSLYTTLLNSYQEMQVSKAGTIGNARIIDYAVLPTGPVRPKKATIMGVALLLGLVVGIGLVFLRRLLHQGIEDPAEVERRLSLPTYATVPYVRAQAQISRRLKRRQQQMLPILALTDPGNVAVESLRSLRTSLHFAMLEASNNIIMLTGPSPGLGKSFTTINLGAVLAVNGQSVVMVDADLRRGYLHEYSTRPRTPGLSEYIAGQAEVDDVLRPMGVPGLQLVPTGERPPNPSELLLHPRFKTLLDELSRRFDYVLVDTAPVLAVTDASIVGALAGTTMLVLKAGEHDLRAIEESVRRLRQSGTTVRGTIFNQMGRRGHSYSYQQGYQYGYSYSYRTRKGT